MSFVNGEIPGIDETDFCAIFARSLFPLLKLNEGVIVHWEGHGYVVHKEFDEVAQEVQVKITQDDDHLLYEDLQLCWLHDHPVGNA